MDYTISLEIISLENFRLTVHLFNTGLHKSFSLEIISLENFRLTAHLFNVDHGEESLHLWGQLFALLDCRYHA